MTQFAFPSDDFVDGRDAEEDFVEERIDLSSILSNLGFNPQVEELIQEGTSFSINDFTQSFFTQVR